MNQHDFNIASLMEAQARDLPRQRAVIFPEGRDHAGNVAWTHLTFEAMNRLSDEYARGLVARGLRRGERVSLLIRPSLAYIPLVFAVFKLGAVPVLIDPGMGLRQFLGCVRRVAPRALIAEPLIHTLMALGLTRGAFRDVEIKLTSGPSSGLWGKRSVERVRIPSAEPFDTVRTTRDETAAVLFTSGSTGPAKGVVYTHGIFHAQARHIRDMYDIQPGERDLACFPLFGLFSMSMGMSVVIPDMDPTKVARVDPARIVEAISTQDCTSAFGSPTLWTRVARYCTERALKLPSLRRVLMAGAPVPISLHESFARILAPGAEIHAPYGATESLPVASCGSLEVLGSTAAATRRGAGTCVGRPAPGIELRIARISDAPIETWTPDLELPTGQIGEICVRGEVVTRSYLNEPEHTAAAKIPCDDGSLFHRMGDVGYLDDQGRLWFCGRKAHRVATRALGELYSVPCEAIFNEHPLVFRAALVGVDGEPVIIVELEPGAEIPIDRLRAELLELGAAQPITAGIQRVLVHPGFPVDVRHNAKIHREQLALWARGRT